MTADTNGEYVVRLEPAVRTLGEVRVVADRHTPLARTGFYDRMQRVQRGAIVGTFITPEELERRSSTLTSHVLTGLPSVRIQRASDGRPIVLGRGGCPMTVLLDGQRLNGLLQEAAAGRGTSIAPNSQMRPMGRESEWPSIDQVTVATEIMAIEVYNSTANAPSELIPLTGGGSCGIIALWTGPRR